MAAPTLIPLFAPIVVLAYGALVAGDAPNPLLIGPAAWGGLGLLVAMYGLWRADSGRARGVPTSSSDTRWLATLPLTLVAVALLPVSGLFLLLLPLAFLDDSPRAADRAGRFALALGCCFLTAAIASIAALFSHEVAIRQRLIERAANAAAASSSQASGCA